MTNHFPRDLENLQQAILSLSSLVEDMIESAGRCLFEPNPELAREVIQADKHDQPHEATPGDGGTRHAVFLRNSATRHIERIADHTTNLAEDVIYLVQGEIVRHCRRLPAATA